MAKSLIAVALLAQNVAFAFNDWNVPCLAGQCSYDVSNGTASGSIALAGSSSAISDITPAAGWSILDCDPNTMAQDIRAVCTGDAASCNHIYQGGAAGTLVRLPQNCTPMAFARVAAEWTHQDQTLPSGMTSNSTNGTAASVRGMRLDTNFAAIDPSQKGSVSLTIQGSSGGIIPASPPTARRDLGKRLSFGKFNKTESDSNPISIDKSFPIFSDSISCPASGALPAFTAGVDINVEAKVDGVVNYGVQAAGSVIPPTIKQIDLFADFNATLEGLLNLGATAQATFDTGRKQVFTVPIAGFDIPGIFQLGPTFNVDLEGIVTIDAAVNMTVGLAYNINNGRLSFPPDQGASSGSFTPADNNLQLLASPDATAQASVEAHVIPNLAFGISALGGLADASINLDLDTSAKLTLTGQASANLTKSTNGTSSATDSFTGCVDVSSTLAVNAGASGSFFDLFNPSTSVTLFSKTFDLFNKCLGTGSGATAAQNPVAGYYKRKHARDIVKRGLTCPTGESKKPTTIADDPIPAASIQSE